MQTHGFTPSGFSVLVVDDEPHFRDSLRQLLEAQGYQVAVAGGGAEAIEVLDSTPFDIVLLDLVMPGVNGRNVLEHIATKGLDTAVIVISGTTSVQEATSALVKGAEDYVGKPYDFDELSRRVRNACEKLALRRENRAVQARLSESEHLHRFIADQSPDAIFIIDGEGCFTYLNGQLVKRLGYFSTDLMGHKLSSIVRDSDIPRLEAHIRAAGSKEATGQTLEVYLEPNHSASDGNTPQQTVPVEIKLSRVTPQSTHTDQIDNKGLSGVIHDLTERIQAEQALQQTNAYLDSILRSSVNIGIAAVDLDFRITYFNPTAERIFGCRADEALGKRVPDIHELEGVAPERFARAIETVMRDGQHHYSVQQEKDGNTCYVKATVSCIRNPKKGIIGFLLVAADVTERTKIEQSLQESEARYRELFDNMSSGVAVYEVTNNGEDLVFRDFNKAGERIDNVRREDLIGKNVMDAFPGIAQFGLLDVFKRVSESGNSERFSAHQYQDERIAGWRDNFVYRLSNGNIVAVYDDITARKVAEQALLRRVDLEELVTSISKNFINIHAENLNTEINKSLKLIGGYAGADRAYLFRFSEDGQTMDNTHEWCATGTKPYIDELKGLPVHGFPYLMDRMLNDEIFYVPVVADLPPEARAEREEFEREGILSIIIVPIRISGATVGFLGFDSTQKFTEWSEEDKRLLGLIAEIFAMAIERKHMEEELKYLATHDAVTGLFNRSDMDRRVVDEVGRVVRYKRPLSIFMVDIDHFKQVNDRYGHAAGDDVLHDIAEILQQTTRTADFVARYGGEEFVIILPETPLAKAKELAERIRHQVAQSSFPVDGESVSLTVSIGIAALSGHSRSWRELLKRADAAMYEAKSAGRNCVRISEYPA